MKKRFTIILTGTLLIFMLLSTLASLNAADSKDWTIVTSYVIPEGASGLTWDGTYLYCGIYGSNGEKIYRIDPSTGSYTEYLSGPQEDAYGLTFDGTYLWTTDHPGSSSDPAVALQFDFSGTLQSEFDLPVHYMSGIAYDNGNFWVARYYPDPGHLYKVDNSGAVLNHFDGPDNQPWDLCIQGEYLWIADYWGDAIYKVDTTDGTLLETHASESTDPSGITWDGTYLWYIDNGGTGGDFLYKVDLYGSGTPIIDVSEDSHDFGTVTVGESGTWSVTVSNVGEGDLEITGLTFSGVGADDLSTTATFPVTLLTDSSAIFPIIWAPLAIGSLDAQAFIASNDPLNSSYALDLTGDAVGSGPEINLPEASHDYGAVRVGAYTRWLMTVQNEGDDVLNITNIVSDNTAFVVDPDLILPISIDVLTEVRIGIWFSPDADMGYSGALTITNNDPDESPLSVPLSGSGSGTEFPMGDTLWSTVITGSYDNSPKAIMSIPDINYDGVADVVIASEDNYIRCFNGNSHNTADLLWEHDISGGAIYMQKGLELGEDIDSDGYPDIVMAVAWGGDMIRVISSRTGAEIWSHNTDEYGDGGWVYDVDCSYDYNGDGIKDVLAATGDDGDDTGPKRVYCLDALTGVSIWEKIIGAPVFSVIGIEDFTGDGQPDALAGSSTSDETAGRAYGINGATSLILWTVQTTGSSVWALAQLDDITGDGIKDVAVGDFSLSSGTVYACDASDGSEVWRVEGLGPLLDIHMMDDVNSDGYSDLLLAHAGSSAIVLSGLDGSYIVAEALVDKPWNVARSNDLDGDGINDIMLGTLYTNNYCYFMSGTDGETLYSTPFSSAVDALNSIPDVTGDGSMEMVAGGRSGEVYCLSGGLNSLINDAPEAPSINGPSSGNVGIEYEFDFLSVDPNNDNLYYYIEWGDGDTEDWIGPYASDDKVTLLHSWDSSGTYIIKARVKDVYNAQSPWSDNYDFTISFLCGDANADHIVNVSDAVNVINYIFIGGTPPNPLESGDVNCDTLVNVSDAVAIINYIFIGGYPPCDPDNNGVPDC